MSQELNPNNSEVQISDSADSQQEKITLWGEIVKGWYWVIFIWKMAGSFAGIKSLLSSIKRTAIMLIKRSLIQLQAKQD